MNSPEIFWYSRKNVRNLQTMNAVVFVHLWVTVFVFIFFVIDPGLSMYANLATYGVFLAITGWAVVTRHRRLLKQYGNQMVILTGMALYRKNGTLVEKLDYRNIRHIEVLEEPDGEIHAIRFWTTEGKVGLQGFENMRTLLKKMEPYVHDLVVIRRHRLRISRKNPFLLHTMIMGATGMLYGIFRWFPESVELTPYLSCILIGLFFFLARPLSGPFGANCRRWELGLGFIFMVLFGIKLLG